MNNITFRRLTSSDYQALSQYLYKLSDDSKKRFGPHGYDVDAIGHLYDTSTCFFGYIAQCRSSDGSGEVVAYTIIKDGLLEHDMPRLAEYGIPEHNCTYMTLAPSVADNWQGCGIGTQMLKFILSDTHNLDVQKVILWGGVQADNVRAVRYYEKNEFHILGRFSYNGDNFDMALDVKRTKS